MKTVVIIPARMGSSRFYGKPLADLCGKPMIEWVYERAKSAKGVSDVIVAACDKEVIDAVAGFGGKAVMTDPSHKSGTDRLAEVAKNLDCDVVVNVQGDEPLIEPESIEKAAEVFDGSVDMASLMVAIDEETAADPNIVKVVTDNKGFAMYFSRSVIPYARDERAGKIYGHIGLYAYTRDFLLKFASMVRTSAEKTESLEQLRVLENGYKIKMIEVGEKPLGVDTPADLEKVRKIIEEANNG